MQMFHFRVALPSDNSRLRLCRYFHAVDCTLDLICMGCATYLVLRGSDRVAVGLPANMSGLLTQLYRYNTYIHVLLQNKVGGVFCCQGSTEKAIYEMGRSDRRFNNGLQAIQAGDRSVFVYFSRLPERREDNSHLQV